MKAVILAAGRGSRMGGLTEERPKCLVEVAGKPLLGRQVEALRAGGVDEIAVVTGYRREILESRGLPSFHNPRWAETNMVMSLAAAADWLRAGPVLVSYSDIFYSPQAVELLRASDADIAITYDPHWLELWSRRFTDPMADAETFRLKPDGTLAEIGGKTKVATEVEGQYMGLLRFAPPGWAKVEALLASLPPERRDRLDMTGMLARLLAEGASIAALPAPWPWGEVDAESDLMLYQSDPATFGLCGNRLPN